MTSKYKTTVQSKNEPAAFVFLFKGKQTNKQKLWWTNVSIMYKIK